MNTLCDDKRRSLLRAAAALCMPMCAAAAPPELGDEQRSALKAANADPTLAPDLLLPEPDMAWWRDAKFGVFVHWGLYAIPARGEWHMFNDKVPAAEYAKLARRFDPRHYDPDAWARLAGDAGARYMVLTARHHDGFSLFASKASHGAFDAPHSAARRDLVAPWVRAVRRHGLRVGLYYSPLDWRFPAYFHPKEMPENARLFKQQTYGQVQELMRQYGTIDILWYDGGWLAHQGTDADAAWFWEPDKLNRIVRRLQPEIVINPRSGWQGDYEVEEGDAAIKGPIRTRPWEKTFSLNGAWGYMPETQVMSTDQVVRLLVDAVVRNGNVLANVGPDADGVVPPKQSQTLRGVGRWLQRYGQAIYGTRPGPLQPVDGVYGMTQRGDRCYLFVTHWLSDELQLPALPKPVTGVRNLSGDEVAWRAGPAGFSVSVPAPQRGQPVTVLEIRTAGGTASGMRNITSLQMSTEMSPGINLGNTLEAIPSETSWGNPVPNQALMNAYKAAGFKSLRIPVAWSQYADANNNIGAAWVAHVKQVVGDARNAGLYVVINIHWDGGWMDHPTFDRQAAINAKIRKFWTQIATAFKDYDDHLLFAGTNEVGMANTWGTPQAEWITVQNGFNQAFVNAVRATAGNNAQRHLVVQAYQTNIDIGVASNTLPSDTVANRLFFEVHYYDPFDFTINDKSRIWQWGSIATDASATETWANESYVDAQMQKMKTKFIDHGVPVILGEYGAYAKPAYPGMQTFVDYWAQVVTRSAAQHRLVPMWWDTGALIDRNTGAQKMPALTAKIVGAATN